MAVLVSCIVICNHDHNHDLSVTVSLNGSAVPASKYGDLFKGLTTADGVLLAEDNYCTEGYDLKT